MTSLSFLSEARWVALTGLVATAGLAIAGELGLDPGAWGLLGLGGLFLAAMLLSWGRGARATAAEHARIGAIARAAARGDLEARVIPVPASGPARALAHDVNALLDICDAFVREAGASLAAAAEGRHYRKVIERGLLGDFGRAAGAINHATTSMGEKVVHFNALTRGFEERVVGVADTMGQSADGFETAAQKIAGSVSKLCHGAVNFVSDVDDFGSTIENVVRAVEDFTASIEAVGEEVTRSRGIANRAVAQADETGAAMDELLAASSRIGKAVEMIRNIADKTNLLSVNASVEAARAGEHGRGFAVVAGEVMALATQTARATQEISRQIAAVRDTTSRAVGTIGGVRATMDEMHGAAETMAGVVERQHQTIRQISGNILTAANGARGMSDLLKSELDRYLAEATAA